MAKLEQKFGLQNPQISVLEVMNPELNPDIMCNRIAQLIERGTAFRRAAMWSLNTVMNNGALGVEVTIAGKLRTERAHFEKHTIGVVPKSGDIAGHIVRTGITHVLTKMGLMGIQLKIASKASIPEEFELKNGSAAPDQPGVPAAVEQASTEAAPVVAQEGVKQDGQA
jgi:small subunit ribosomal protein S3